MTFAPDFTSHGQRSQFSVIGEICSASDQTDVRPRMELPFGHPLARDGAGTQPLLFSMCVVGISFEVLSVYFV